MIRVPVALVPKILEYARALDKCIFFPPGMGDILNKLIVLQAIDEYVEWKRQNYHPNQNSKELDINTRAWDEFRKFRAMVEGDKGDKGGKGELGV